MRRQCSLRAVAWLAATIATFGCGGKDPGPAPAGQPASSPKAEAPVTPASPAPPATLTDVNIAAADMGGAVEEVTGFYGSGYFGRRLIDGLNEPTWRAPADWWPGGMYNEIYWTKYPQDILVSFYERMPALVGAVTFVVPEKPTVAVERDPSTAPVSVEIWTSMELAPDKFRRTAAATLDAKGGEQKVTFPATEAKFVKVRLLSGATKRVVEISELRVLESVREGYVPLFAREMGASHWKGSPREAAQRGLDWLQQAAVDWGPKNNNCFGCHVQAQALMGQAIALEKKYRVSLPAMQALTDLMRSTQTQEGTLGQNHAWTSAGYGGMGFAYAAQAKGASNDPAFFKAADYLLKIRKDGSIPWEFEDPPIIKGSIPVNANALVSFEWAATQSKDPKYRQAADGVLAWIVASKPESNQDLVFKIVSLTRYGSQEQKRLAWPLVEELASRQQEDGGWKEVPAMKASNAFATGQVLYAFKQAGVSIRAAMFQRGVDFLLKTQATKPDEVNGFWKAANTESQHASDFAPTMWAVIGLAGAYGTDPKGALRVTREQGDKPTPRNLEIVLDVSGSMNTKLGDSTRWQTALKVLEEVVKTLPTDLKVGLRVYGHRYPSKSAQTCQDTELVVPIGPLDRDRLVQTASRLQPRGETPLIHSVLKTTGDLKAVGGGSVILITDGEESCRGNAQSAAAEIKKSGVNVTLNIVGFTITGKAVESVLGGLAGSTGGRYYGAQDGGELSRALKIAAVQTLPYDVLDASGNVIASAQSGQLDRELPAGKFTVRIRALDQVLDVPVTITADQTSSITIGIEDGRFVVRR